MQVPRALGPLPDRQPVEDLPLQGGAEPLHLAEPILSRRLFELGEGVDTQLLVESVDLLGAQARNRQQLQYAFRDVLAHAFQQWMRAGAMQLGHDIGDGVADAGDLAQPVLVDDPLQRLAERGEAFGRAQIGARAVVIVAGERGAPPEFDQQLGDRRRVEFRHADQTCPARQAFRAARRRPTGSRRRCYARFGSSRRYLLNQSSVRCQASLAAASS
jgi:hypothetical protein